MPQETNLNVFPYFDDFDRSKNFYKVLFKPGYPVQARELTTVQSILQNQIEQFGTHTFKEGSVVIPGQLNYNNQFFSVQIENTYNNIPVSFYVDEIVGKIIKGNTTKIRAKIISVVKENEQENSNIILFVNYLNTGVNSETVFNDSETLLLEESITKDNLIIQQNEGFANTIVARSTSVGSAIILSQGVYFLRGTFVDVEDQLLILDPFSVNTSYKVGFQIREEIISSNEDSSLVDNAQGFSNYSAPGADRFKITAKLIKKSLDSTNNESFVSLLDIREGVLVSTKNRPDYNILQDELARRTSEESGDYYVRPFSVSSKETLYNGLGNNGLFKSSQLTYNNNVPSEDLATYKISDGKAYVKGYEVEIPSTVFIDYKKPRTTRTLKDQSINYITGSTFTLNRVYGSPKLDLSSPFIVSLRNERIGSASTTPAGKEIGLARVYDFALESGSYNTNSPQLNQWDLALFDIETYTEITLNEPITLNTPVHIKGKSSGATGFLRYNVSNSNLITLYGTQGNFSVGEKFIFNGTETLNRTSTSVVTYSNNDVQSISNYTGQGEIFNGDVIPAVNYTVGFSSITSSVSGISTVTISTSQDFIFSSNAKIGNIVAYTKPSTTIPTFSRILSVGEKSLTIAGITTVTEVCDGSLPSSNISVNDFVILSSRLQPSPDNTLYTSLTKPYISSVDLSNSSCVIRKEIPVVITDGSTGQITTDDNESFLPFDEERYILIRSNGTFETLTSDKFVFGDGSKSLVIIGLGANDANARLVCTLSRVNLKEKTKIKNRIRSLVIDKSRNQSSGIGSTTLNDGLTYGNFPYGTRVQDEEICLMVPDVTRIYAILESSDPLSPYPILPSLNISSLNGPTNKTDDIVIGEEFVGEDSGAIAVCVSRLNSFKIEYTYLNDKIFTTGERIIFSESGISGIIESSLPGDKNVLNNYYFNYGQKETIYDYAKIIRNEKFKEPTRKLRVIYEHATFDSSDSGDFTTVNSYNQYDYCTITFAKDSVNNSDIIDIRPKVVEFDTSVVSKSPFEFFSRTFSSTSNSAKNILASDESLNISYSYYLPRIDRIFLTKDGVFQLNQGEPSEIPQDPPAIEDGIEIAKVVVPPYLCDASRVTIDIIQHKRYQMSDIAKLEQRVKNLESYTSLNFLESDTENLKIKDNAGLDRFKSGFFVDNFTTTNSQNRNTTIKNSIDTKNGELRPAPYTTEVDLLLGSRSLVGIGTSINPQADPKYVTDLVGNNIRRTGQLLSLDYTDVEYIDQPFATRSENVTPYLVTRYNGTIELYPSSDTWVDQVRVDAKRVEIDNFTATQQQLVAQGWDPQTGYSPITWGAWETTWTGQSTTYQSYWSGWGWPHYGYYGYGYPYHYGWYGYPWYNGYYGHYYGWWGYSYPYYYHGWPWYRKHGWYGYWGGHVTTLATTTKTGVSTREGTRMKLEEQINTYSQGDSIIATDFISYMRSRNVEFTGKRFKPFTRVYAFFDGEDVNQYIIPKLMEITMKSGVFRVGETIIGLMPAATLVQNSTSGITPNQIYFRCAQANHRYGPFNAPTDIFTANPYNSEITTNLPSTYTSSSEILNVDTYSLSEQAQGDYYGYIQKGMILRGQSSGAEATVRDIRLFTDQVGTVIGSYFIPNPNVPTNPTFETGTKTFRLTSSPINSTIEGVTDTSGEQSYYAQGILNTVQETIVSVRSANITSEKLQESKNVTETSTSVSTSAYGWYRWPNRWRYRYGKWGYCYWDPLAQSFLVEEENGVFVTKVDLYFRTKDAETPIILQLRTVSNGVPTTEILPFSEIVVEPKDINISANSSVSTTIRFPSPVYLKGGKEYALVILSQSNEYNVWISRLGETDTTTLSLPESQRVVVTQQVLLGSLFKSQNGSTWDASQYEDLKFKLYKAKFDISDSGDINFYNPDLNIGNKQIANLIKDPINFNSRMVKIGLGSTITGSLTFGNTITQTNSNASGNYIGIAGSAFGTLGIINAGIGYSNGYYANVNLKNVTSVGKDATANITISNGEIVSSGATIQNGGSGYKIGDIFTVSSLGGTTLGRNIRLSLTQTIGNNQIIVDNVQGDFITGVGNTILYTNDSGTFQVASNGVNYVDVDNELSDGLHIQVNHKNHGMHSKANSVTIKDVYSDVLPVLLKTAYTQTSSGSTLIEIDDSFTETNINNFNTFENSLVSTSNPGYIKIDDEIIAYTSVDLVNKTLGGITRSIDGTVAFAYSAGTPIFKYEINKVSLRRINKTHSLQDSNISKSIALDSYYLKLDMSTSDKTDPRGLPYSQVNRSIGTTYPKLYINETKSGGGTNIYATQNIAYEIVKPIIETMDLTETTLKASIKTVSGTSADGNEESFTEQGFEPINLKENTYLSSPRIVCSKVNENQKLSNLPGKKSFTLNLQLSSGNEDLSPVIDLDRVGMIFNSNRIDSVVDDFVNDFRISTLEDDPSSFVYATNPVSLSIPSTSIKILVSAHVNKFSDIRALYAIMKDPGDNPIYYPFPGFNNLYTSGQVKNISLSDGTSDNEVPKSDGNGFLSTELSYRDYEFTIDNLPEFKYFSIKFIGVSENQAYPPRLRSLRVIALA